MKEKDRIEEYFNAELPVAKKSVGPKDDGKPRRRKRKKKPGTKPEIRHALTATDMLFDEVERNVYAEYEKRLTRQVALGIPEGEEFPVHYEILVALAANGIIRLRRKSRLEAAYGRPFDRNMSQDPQAQILNAFKALGLLNEKKQDNQNAEIRKVMEKQINNDSDAIGKISASDEFASWRDQVIKDHGGSFEIKLKTPTDRVVYDDATHLPLEDSSDA